jgi:uncharacterized hydrophobic protein (TIGR00271 family)
MDQKQAEEKKTEETEKQLAISLNDAFKNLKEYLKRILNIHEGTDVHNTEEGIRRDIEFKGPNLWILIFSIFIASIGLNTNSPAVIIGAMLISPLMGPILGVGLGVGTYDFPLLRKSFKSFVTMVFIALISSTIYFLISPISDAQSELLARVRPTLLDVFVAFFGGLAGIVAGSRKEKSNVIPGVAIATALMPPLCTAGYGLATFQFYYFIGALYLFVINSIFIGLATLIGVRYLQFPKVDFVNTNLERKTKRITTLILILAIVPSSYTFYQVVVESFFYRNLNNYISDTFHYDDNIISHKIVSYDKDEPSVIVFFVGGKVVPKELLDVWEKKKFDYNLGKLSVKVIQSGSNYEEYANLMEQYKAETFKELFFKNQEELKKRDEQIAFLEAKLNENAQDSALFSQVARELKAQYPQLDAVSYGRSFRNDFISQDTLEIVRLEWAYTTNDSFIQDNTPRIYRWLLVRLDTDTVMLLKK